MKPKKFRNFVSRSLPTTAFLAMSAAVVSTAFSANVIWDGGPAGTGTDLGLAANWAGDVVPSTAVPDAAVWDGTVAGPLALVYTTTTIGGAPGNPGIDLSIAATQTSSLSLDSGLNTSALRVNAVTVADGAGPVTIGDGNDIFNLTIGGTAVTSQVWTNNSLTNAATVSSDVRFGLGGAGDHTLNFTGPGDWDVAAPISASNGGAQLSLFKTGTGELTLSGGGNLNNNALAILGATQCAALKEGTTRITSGTYTCNTKEFTVGGLDAGAGTDTQLIMDGGSVTGVSWLSVGKGNGDGTASSDLILNNAASITSTNISLGWLQTNPTGPAASITLNDTSSITTNGTNNIGESTGAVVTMTLNDSSSFNTTNKTVEIGQNSATATVNLNGTSTFSSNLTRIGRGNNNTATAKGYVNVDGGTLNSEGDLVLAYAGSATALGRLTIDSGTVNVATTTKRWMIMQQYDLANAEVVMNGGNLNLNTNTDIRFAIGNSGSVGTNVFTLNDGSVTSFSDNKTTPLGGGVLDLNQAGGAGANNTFHLNGGTLTIRAVNTNNDAATAAFNFNGGLLKATGNDANFVNLGGATQTVNVLSGGALIDSNGFNVGIVDPLQSTGSDGGLTKSGAGTLTLQAAASYDGPTTVTGGTLELAGTATIDSSSGVTINGADAKLMVSNFAAGDLGATTPVVVTQGGVDGNGTIDSLTVADDPVNTVQAGAGNLGDLTVNTLVFQGDAQVTLQATGAFMDQVIYATDLTTTGASGKVTVNVANTLNAWSSDASGYDYTVIDYAGGSFTGSISDFQVGSVPDLNPNQTASLVDTGSAIVLRITGEPLIWVGNDGATWDTSNSSWDYQGSGTMFSANSPVEFNDDADEFVVEIGENVSPSVTLFNNSIDYTFNSTGGFGIAGGSVIKNGFGTVTLSTVNTYDGTTSINEGEILLTGNGSISDSSTITVGASGELNFDVTGNSEYANVIAGSGLITKGGTGTVTFSGANTHTGDLYLNEGGLNLNSVSALGAGPGIFTINGGTIDNTSGADLVLTGAKPIFWDGDFSFTGTDSLALGGGAVTMGGSGTSRTVNVVANSLGVGAIAGPGFDLVKTGAGTLVTNGILDIDGILDIQGGTLAANQDVIAAAPMGSGILENEGSVGTKWTFWDGSTDYTSNLLIRDNDGSHQFQLGIVKRGTGSLTLTNASNNTTAQLQVESGKLVLDAGTYKRQNGDTTTLVGGAALIGSAAAANGVLVIDGATVDYNNLTNADALAYRGTLNIGANATGAGAVMLSSGTFNVHRQLAVGSTGGSFAAYSQSDGTATVGGFLAVGLGTAQGVVNLSGGTYNQGGPVTNGAGAGSTGVISLSGDAAYNQTSVGDLGLWVGESGTGVLNVSGSSTLTIVSGNNGLQLGRNASGVGTVNLLGGTVTAKAVYKGAGTGSLSFNGGTLASNAANTAFLTGLTSAYVHAGGGTVDNGGNAITIGQPLLAPTGGGVTATGLTPGGSGYIDTPIVTVTGDGTGASAVAEIDEFGNLTGVTITNPGVGYTTAGFTLVGGGIGNTGAIDGTAAIVPNVSGGMTFSGSATTTLTGVNTYTGNTTVTAGTLVIGTGGAVTVKPTANNTSSKITGAGTLSFVGTLRIDLSEAAIANGNSWVLEDVASPFYTPGSFAVTSASLGAFTEQGDGVTHVLVDGNNTWSFSETTGVLSLAVAAPSGFDSWITGFGLDPADQDPTDDPDNDGVSNIAEYVLGRDPSEGEGAATTGAKNGANFELTFERADLAQAAGDVSILIEYGNNLAGWTEVAVPATSGVVSGVTFTITDGSPTDEVVASIPTSSATEFFARVKVVK